MNWQIGIDTGGTFTDVVAINTSTGDLRLHKVHSTPAQPAQAVIDSVLAIADHAGFGLDDIALIVHGSTVATNVVLTRTGAAMAMVTTKGFRDVLLIRRQNRPELYNLRSRRPPALLPRANILEIPERTLSDGTINVPLQDADIAALADQIRTLDVEAVVVGLLNSYVNPAHELAIGERLQGLLPNVSICLSHQISRSQGEFERFSTTVLNGYIQPVVSSYLGHLEEQLRAHEITAPLFMMKSNGGVSAASVLAERSVEMLLSGPAGGVVAGCALARQHSSEHLITADMGGTSFDVAMIYDGAGVFTQERMFADQTIRLPMMDIDTIGAGGGSIGWVDAGGALRVGPQSAGAAPGPACYSRGGTQPTVTDANLVLGRLATRSAMAGGFELDGAAARQAIDTLATVLDMSIEETAEGMLHVVNAAMTSAIRRLTVERGHDPANFSLCPCGGAGPLHGAELGREIGMREVVVPAMPGVFSAAGLLLSELREEQIHCRLDLLTEMLPDLPEIFDELLQEPTNRLLASGGATERMRVIRRLRLRYLGQGHDLAVNLTDGPLQQDAIEHEFHRRHRRAYGYDFEGDPVEVVAAWVSVSVDLQDPTAATWPEKPVPTPASRRSVIFDGIAHDTPVYERPDLGAGYANSGPAIIEQADTTIIVLPDMAFRVDAGGQVILQTGESHA